MPGFLKDEEVDAIVLALKRGEGEIDEAKAEQILDWADSVRIDQNMLDLAIAGEVDLLLPSEAGGEMRFRINEVGKQRVERDILPKLRGE